MLVGYGNSCPNKNIISANALHDIQQFLWYSRRPRTYVRFRSLVRCKNPMSTCMGYDECILCDTMRPKLYCGGIDATGIVWLQESGCLPRDPTTDPILSPPCTLFRLPLRRCAHRIISLPLLVSFERLDCRVQVVLRLLQVEKCDIVPIAHRNARDLISLAFPSHK